jgi:hypothetical protein
MKKSMYSLILMDDLVKAVDKQAHESGLAAAILSTGCWRSIFR